MLGYWRPDVGRKAIQGLSNVEKGGLDVALAAIPANGSKARRVSGTGTQIEECPTRRCLLLAIFVHIGSCVEIQLDIGLKCLLLSALNLLDRIARNVLLLDEMVAVACRCCP